MTQTLDWLQYIQIAIGVLVLVGLAAAWAFTGWRDPLRHCPQRGNHLTLPAIGICVVLYFIAAKAATLALPALAPNLSPGVQQSAINLCAQLVGIASALTVGAFAFRRGLAGLGFTTRNLGVSILAAVMLFFAFEPIGGGVLLFMFKLFEALHIPIVSHPTVNLIHDPNTPRWYVPIAWISAAVLAPLAEETFFRGLLQTWLRRVFANRWVGLFAAATFFGLVHYGQPTAVLPLALFGLATGFIYERTGSLVGPVLFHACFNLKTLIFQTLHGPITPG